MARCKDTYSNKKRFFHYWKGWSKPFQSTYKGVQTLVQCRECLYCKKVQVKEL